MSENASHKASAFRHGRDGVKFPHGHAGWRGLLLPGLLTLVGVIVLVWLGVWQVQRLHWKEALIARITERTHEAPVALPPEPEWVTWSADHGEYRPVWAEGILLHERSVFVHGNAELGSRQSRMGYFVLTPLQLANGASVIVNRGFVPIENRTDVNLAPDTDTVSVEGLLRAPQSRNWFIPDDNPERGDWFTRDPQAIADAYGWKRVAPFLIDAFDAQRGVDNQPHRPSPSASPPTWPRGGLTVVTFPNNHLDYAATWFGLAFVLVVIFALFARRHLAGAAD